MLVSSHPCIDVLPAFALGALDAEEMCRIGAHLSECPRCRAKAHPYLAVVSLLALAAPRYKPPAFLKQRILACLTDSHTHMHRTIVKLN